MKSDLHTMRTSSSGVSHVGGALVLAAAFALAFACASASDPNGSDNLSPSTIQTGVLQPGRLYSLAVPAGYTGDEAVPLVLALHYGGHGQPYFGLGMLTGLMEPALRKLRAIIVAPDCTGQDWTDPQSETDVLAVLDFIEDTYNIDRRWTLVAGYSMGGIGTWHLAGRYPSRFAAGVVVSGSPPSGTPDPDWEVPIYLIHSTGDEVLPIGPTAAAAELLLNRGVRVAFVVLDGIGHYDTVRFIEALEQAVPWIEDVWQR